MRDLKSAVKGGVVYDVEGGNGGKLHWTLMQIRGFGFDRDEYNDERLFGAIRGSLDGPVIDVVFDRVMICGTGLMICGIPVSRDVNSYRDNIRRVLRSKMGSYYDEPFHNDIVHSTIYRCQSGASEDEQRTAGQ